MHSFTIRERRSERRSYERRSAMLCVKHTSQNRAVSRDMFLQCMKEGKTSYVKYVINTSQNSASSRHEGRKDFQCEICEKSFTLKTILKKHISTVHKGRKDFL